MKWTTWATAGLLALGAASTGLAAAGVGVGDKAPDFEGKEFVNTSSVSLKQLQGQVIVYEIFRTW